MRAEQGDSLLLQGQRLLIGPAARRDKFPARGRLKFLTKCRKSLILVLPGTLFLGRPENNDHADVAELADAQASGACAPRGVEVRLLSSALCSYPVSRISYILCNSRLFARIPSEKEAEEFHATH